MSTLDEITRRRLRSYVARIGLTRARSELRVASWTLDKLLLGYRSRADIVDRVRARVCAVRLDELETCRSWRAGK